VYQQPNGTPEYLGRVIFGTLIFAGLSVLAGAVWTAALPGEGSSGVIWATAAGGAPR